MLNDWFPTLLSYCTGGENATSSYNIVERYSLNNDKWQFMPSMKQKRSGCGVAVCDGKVYVAGRNIILFFKCLQSDSLGKMLNYCFNLRMFLAGLAAYCAMPPCKPLHGALLKE